MNISWARQHEVLSMTALSAIALSEDRRAQAAALVHARGIPHRRIEEWKYSDLRAALGEAGVGAVVAEYLVSNLPSGMEVWDLARPGPPQWVMQNFGTGADNTMSAASLALSSGGIALRLPKGLAPADPLKLDFIGAGHIRALLVVEEGASLNLVEGVGAADFRNVGFEIVLCEGASLDHMRISPAMGDAVLVEEAAVRVAAGASYRGHFTGLGARLSRMELAIALEGEGAQAHLSGVALLDASRHSDVTTHVSHIAVNTASTQLFKHVAAGKSRAVYQGKVTVAKGADGSDSQQTAKALLLGEGAEADLKPELEILADDVKCVHGAAVGDLDAESLFYLCSRGIPEAAARRLLLQAFLEDAVAQIAHDDNRELARTELMAALEAVT
jgi:Fe-S cluster assembly protein SufD